MTTLPATTEKKLGLVIDLDSCVGCQACVTSCKEWNTGGHMAPLTDLNPYEGGGESRTVYFPRCCLHCEKPACVAACPTSARHFGDLGDPETAVSKLVVDRGGVDLMPDLDYRPTNKYLPPRAQTERAPRLEAPPALEPVAAESGFLGWVDLMLSN